MRQKQSCLQKYQSITGLIRVWGLSRKVHYDWCRLKCLANAGFHGTLQETNSFSGRSVCSGLVLDMYFLHLQAFVHAFDHFLHVICPILLMPKTYLYVYLCLLLVVSVENIFFQIITYRNPSYFKVIEKEIHLYFPLRSLLLTFRSLIHLKFIFVGADRNPILFFSYTDNQFVIVFLLHIKNYIYNFWDLSLTLYLG